MLSRARGRNQVRSFFSDTLWVILVILLFIAVIDGVSVNGRRYGFDLREGKPGITIQWGTGGAP